MRDYPCDEKNCGKNSVFVISGKSYCSEHSAIIRESCREFSPYDGNNNCKNCGQDVKSHPPLKNHYENGELVYGPYFCCRCNRTITTYIGKDGLLKCYSCGLTNLKVVDKENQETKKEAVETANKDDKVNHPSHYTSHPSGIEAITVVEHMSFNVGNAVKYCWRADHKHESPIEDLEKAKWYIEREIQRLTRQKSKVETQKK